MPTICPDVRQINSTSYVDVLGILLGLTRLPGEESVSFLDRLYRASISTRDHSFEGVVNEISLRLGLGVSAGISVTGTDSMSNVMVNVSGVSLTCQVGTFKIPILSLDPDGLWSWRKLSDVVADINATGQFSATLNKADGPALQIVSQSNFFTAVGEQISGVRELLDHPGVVVGSESFNIPTPPYTLLPSGALSFSSEPASNLRITYQYRAFPYDIVCSEVGIFSFLDPGLPSVAITPDNVMVYQLREAIQDVMNTDRSYWAK